MNKITHIQKGILTLEPGVTEIELDIKVKSHDDFNFFIN